MASNKALEDDEYLAGLLAAEAKESSIRYSHIGLSALLPKRPTGTVMKPNTRFLKSIVQEANNHNAALKKKEELEARIRLRTYNGPDGRLNSRQHDSDRSGRRKRRHDEDHHISSDRHDGKRSKRSDRSTRSESPPRRENSRQRQQNEQYHRRQDGGRLHKSSSRQRSDRRSRSRSREGKRDSRSEEHNYDRRRHRHEPTSSPSESDSDSKKQHHHRHHSSRDTRRESMRSQDLDCVSPNSSTKRRQRRSLSADSDPLESIIGPMPPNPTISSKSSTRSRGRGAHKSDGSMRMDSHFSSSYDPFNDINIESEDSSERNDWDMALEALRDRQAWKQKHSERLREAGFGEDEIKRWEDSAGGREKDATDVRWRKKGEAREWDKGRIVQDEDDVDRGTSIKGKAIEDGWRRKDSGFLKGFRKALG